MQTIVVTSLYCGHEIAEDRCSKFNFKLKSFASPLSFFSDCDSFQSKYNRYEMKINDLYTMLSLQKVNFVRRFVRDQSQYDVIRKQFKQNNNVTLETLANRNELERPRSQKDNNFHNIHNLFWFDRMFSEQKAPSTP